MIAFLIIVYSLFYILLFNKLKLIPKNTGTISAFAGVGVVMIGAIVFMWYTFSPVTQDARMFRYIIPIVPNVRGEVVDVPIQANVPIARDEVLFRIDPEPYEIAVRQLEAQVERHRAEQRLAQVNVERAEKLLKTQAAAQIDLDTWVANRDIAAASIESASAQLDDARWKLRETEVRAPNDGYVLNLQLRPGNVVTTVPVASPMAFVSTEMNTVLASFSQSAIRKVAVGDAAEIVFTNLPGQTHSGRIERIVRFGQQSQLMASGQLPTLSGAPANDRWAVLMQLDDDGLSEALPQGAGGTLAVYTQSGKPVHIISKVALRITAWLGYLTAP